MDAGADTPAGGAAGTGAPAGTAGRAVRLRARLAGPAFTVRLRLGIIAVRSWFGIRRAVGWRQASRWRRFTVVLGALCALSFVTGVAVATAEPGAPTSAAAGIGVPSSGAALANRDHAAAWIAQQVSPDVTVSCDPEMCGQLRENGFPAARLMAVSPTAAGPLRSGVVIATPAIRNQFGARLATAFAPLVIASFGSGPERVDVRMVAPDGAAAFQAQLGSAHASLVSAGRQLLANKNIQAGPAARAALRAGQVDWRLLASISALASQRPIRLAAFGDLPPGAGSGVPLLGAEIGAASPGALLAILTFLRAQQSPYRPAVAVLTRSAGGPSLVAVRFDVAGLPDGPS